MEKSYFALKMSLLNYVRTFLQCDVKNGKLHQLPNAPIVICTLHILK